jgi:ketopantoate reductase
MRFVIYGAGAIGGVIGARLHLAAARQVRSGGGPEQLSPAEVLAVAA